MSCPSTSLCGSARASGPHLRMPDERRWTIRKCDPLDYLEVTGPDTKPPDLSVPNVGVEVLPATEADELAAAVEKARQSEIEALSEADRLRAALREIEANANRGGWIEMVAQRALADEGEGE